MVEIPGQDINLIKYFIRYEMLLIKYIFSFPAPKYFLQFQINYKIGFALWYPMFCFRYIINLRLTLIWMGFSGHRFEVGEEGYPCLKLVRIMLET